MDAQAANQTLRKLTYGLYIVTAADGDKVAGGAVGWLSQASFNPPLIMAAIQRESGLGKLVAKSGAFAVHVLASGQDAAARAFFRPSEVQGQRLNGYPFRFSDETGAPILHDLPAWIEARVVESIERGDHTVYVAEVVSAGVHDPEAKPMVMWDTDWTYAGLRSRQSREDKG
jgi:flavin reductase (DIM6/NTAB) family NADH-FMN oxidoreductase RutF